MIALASSEIALNPILGLAAFAAATSITPGPNNLMLMASGARFGPRATLPHLLGVSLGFAAMAAALGLGLAPALEALPGARAVLSGLCLMFLLWIAWRIAHASPPGEARVGERPMSFVEAAAFQWINPKSVSMALTTVTLYTASPAPTDVAAAALLFAAINFPCCGLWALAGARVARFLHTPRRARAFNIAMAVLVVASAAPMLP